MCVLSQALTRRRCTEIVRKMSEEGEGACVCVLSQALTRRRCTEIVRKISEEGKGVCRKRATREVRSLRRMYDGRRRRW